MRGGIRKEEAYITFHYRIMDSALPPGGIEALCEMLDIQPNTGNMKNMRNMENMGNMGHSKGGFNVTRINKDTVDDANDETGLYNVL